jgi:hypothetical protein
MGAASGLTPTQPLATKPPLGGAPPVPQQPAPPQQEAAPAPWSSEELQQKYEQTKQKIKAINDSTGALQPPKLDTPPKPDVKQTNPVEIWGSAAMFMATVGSLMTRQHLTTALNSAAGVMQSFKKQDQDAMNQAFEEWKVSSDNAIKMANFEMEAYKSALAKSSKDESAAMAEFTAYAHAFGNHTTAQLGEQRLVLEAKKYVLDAEKATGEMEKTNLEIAEKQDSMNIAMDLNKASVMSQAAAKSGDPNQIKAAQDFQAEVTERAQNHMTAFKGTGGGAGGLYTDEDIGRMVDQRLQGDKSVGQGNSFGYRSVGDANRKKYNEALTKRMKEEGVTGADMARRDAEYGGLKTEEQTLGRRSAGIEIAADEAGKMADQARAASAAVPRAGWKVVNDFILAGKTETSDPKLRQLLIASDALVNARARAISPSGQLHLADQIEGRKLLAGAFSAGDYNASVDQFLKEIEAMKAAPADVRRHIAEGFEKGGKLLTEHSIDTSRDPKPGTVVDGYTFLGGDPKNKSNWTK